VIDSDGTEFLLDERDPASDLEAKEEAVDRPVEAQAAAIGRVIAWLLQGQTLPAIGTRAIVASRVLRPDLVGHPSLRELSVMARIGKSTAGRLCKDFEKTVALDGRLDQVNSSPASPPWVNSPSQPARSRSKA